MFCDQKWINIKTLVLECRQVHNALSEMLGAKCVWNYEFFRC